MIRIAIVTFGLAVALTVCAISSRPKRTAVAGNDDGMGMPQPTRTGTGTGSTESGSTPTLQRA